MTTLVLVLAAFLLGLLWGGLHSVVWIQLTYPSLFAMARRARGDLDRPLPGAMAPGALRNFAGSLFGTTATGGVFAFLGEGRLNLALFAIGICLGFAPALVKLLQKFVGYISILVVVVALSAGLRSGAIDLWGSPRASPRLLAERIVSLSARPQDSSAPALREPLPPQEVAVEGDRAAYMAGGTADEYERLVRGGHAAAASDDLGIWQLAEFPAGSVEITKEMAQSLDRWCSRVGKLEKSRVVVEIRGRAEKGEARQPYGLGARRGKNVQAYLAATCGLLWSWVVSTGAEAVPLAARGSPAARAANRGVLLVAELGPSSAAAAAPGAAPGIGALLQAGRDLLSEGQFEAAADRFVRADEVAGGRCDECLLGVARAVRQGTGHGEAAIGSAGEAFSVLRGSLRRDPGDPLAAAARISLCLARLAGPVAFPRAGAEPIRQEDALAVTGAIKKPRKLYAPAPRYTEAAREARVEGTLILESVIDDEGCVSDVRVLKALHPDFDQAALTAARRWVFQPAELEGRPVKVFLDLTVQCQLGGGK